MVRLIMNEGHRHVVFGKMINAGEEFYAPESEALTWIKMGRARQASTKVETVEEKEDPPQKTEGARRKRYSRSDLRAED